MCTKSKNLNYPRSKSLLQDYQNPIYNSLIGHALVNKNLVILENHNIAFRRDHKTMKGKVKIIGGGGAGIEPSEICYIGKGMLTAVVVGGLYSAPSADEILIAIRELALDNHSGILLLVKNYIGDKLNFGIALDRALKEDITVKMLVLGDDASGVVSESYGRRAFAGCALIYKIAGEMAEQEKTLEEIVDECREHFLTDLATVSVTLPAYGKTFCESLGPFIEPDELVLGMGVYGQFGHKKIKFCNISSLVSVVLEEITAFSKNNFELLESEVVILVNNYGSISKVEEAIIAMEVSEKLNANGNKISLLYSGTFMSSANNNGFSITLLKINSPDTLKYLEAPTEAAAWPKPQVVGFEESKGKSTIQPECQHNHLNKARYEDIPLGPSLTDKGVSALKQTTIFAAEALISCEKQLNIIDSETGDGDTGTTLRRGAEALKTALISNQINTSNPSKFLYDLSEICCKNMGGVSGALYSVFFGSAGKVFHNAVEITPELCCGAFKSAVKAIKNFGKAEAGDRTVLDALCPAVDTFESSILHGKNVIEALYLAAATCEFKSEETKRLKPPWQIKMNINKPLLYADAGAHAATIWLRAVSEGLRLTYPNEC